MKAKAVKPSEMLPLKAVKRAGHAQPLLPNVFTQMHYPMGYRLAKGFAMMYESER